MEERIDKANTRYKITAEEQLRLGKLEEIEQ